jgi:3-hydroxyacyl-CoA dehydrogenase/enoyl-CoA hydratase/carnithine racemase
LRASAVHEQAPLTAVVTTRDVANDSRIAIITLVPATEGKPAVFGPAGLDSLNAAITTIAQHISTGSVSGVVITGSDRTFCAGADLDFMASFRNVERAREFADQGQRVFVRLSQLGVPVVAAINGVALGGGLELALHCAWRVGAKSVKAIGLPEISLGLLPGWGGTTLLPRLVGLKTATQIFIDNPVKGNKLLSATESLSMGIIDEICDDGGLIDVAVARASTALEPRPVVSIGDDEKNALALHINQLALRAANPATALERTNHVVARTHSVTDGLILEAEALAELICTSEFRNRVYSFHLTSQRARKPSGLPSDPPRTVSRVGVIGAGLMASQFVSLFAERLAVPVVMTDVSHERLDLALARVADALDARVGKGQIDVNTRDAILQRIDTTLDHADFSDCDFVMEAVFEDFDVKRSVLTEIEKVVSATAVLATNTSSLSVTKLAETLSEPARLVGFHFFNPVAVMPLIEIVATPFTDPSVTATAASVAGLLRKAPVLVNDKPGFVVNRVLSAYLSAVFVLVDNGIHPDDITRSLEPIRLPMNPFALVDLIGRTVTLHMIQSLSDFAPDRISVSKTLTALEHKSNSESIQSDIESVVASQAGENDLETLRIFVEDAIAREIDTLLAESVVHAIEDVDLCLINGAAWPVASGGISKYLDECGASLRVRGTQFHPAQ